jgi:GNAT superfamily N-acetyltransferase
VSSYTIREARDDELDTISSLIVDAYAQYAAHMSPDAWSSFANEIANVRGRLGDSVLLVAEEEGQLIGSVTMFAGWRGTQEGTAGVRLLAVLPEHRGGGVGRALLQACVDRARSAGKSRLVMTTAQDMAVLRDLTERMGFVRELALDHEPAPGVRIEGFALDLDNDEGTAS